MARESTTPDRPEGGTSRRSTNGASHGRMDEVGAALRAAGDQVGGAVVTVRDSVPEVARASRELLDDAMKRIESGSDQQVTAGITLSLGLAIGMLVGGAPRMFVAAALVPVAAMGLVLMDRRALGRAGGGPGATTGGSAARGG